MKRIDFEQQANAPPPQSWAERRRFWTEAILQGMARLEGESTDPKQMEQFDQELEQARSRRDTVPAAQQLQRDTIRELRRFVAALEAAGDDRRRQINVVWELLEDMSLHPHWWNGKVNGLDRACGEAERALVRMTAQMPIRFTHIALGGDAGPHWVSGFVSGSVTDEEAVRQSSVYQGAVRDYPEVTAWPALCTVYVGRDLSYALGTADASGFDLEIMNRTGDRFLNEHGVRWLSGPYQMTIAAAPEPPAQKRNKAAVPQTEPAFMGAGRSIGPATASKFNIPLVAAGLTAYAAERQTECEKARLTGDTLWAERRRFWADDISQKIRCTSSRESDRPACGMLQALKIEPGAAPEIVTLPNTLESLQDAVGGQIEALGLECGVCLLCNEEGKLLGLPANRPVGGDIIAGTFLIVGEADGEFCSLSDADAAYYSQKFVQPLPSCGGPDEPVQWEFHVF